MGLASQVCGVGSVVLCAVLVGVLVSAGVALGCGSGVVRCGAFVGSGGQGLSGGIALVLGFGLCVGSAGCLANGASQVVWFAGLGAGLVCVV